MDHLLYPRAKPNGPDGATTVAGLQVWIGITQCNTQPTLSWFLNDQPVTPNPDRIIQPIRPNALAPSAGAPRTWSGLYDFQGLQPGRVYRLRVEALIQGQPLQGSLDVRTLPNQIPAEGFHIFLCSCFHRSEALANKLQTALQSLTKRCAQDANIPDPNEPGQKKRPDLSLLMGDQVYLDLPTIEDFPEDIVKLADKFEQNYLANWMGAKFFDEVLGAAPFIAAPDDHEFWNNFPHRSPFIQNSYTQTGRDKWKQAALAIFNGFQAPFPKPPGGGVQIDVPPVSIFVADTRTFRKETGRKKTFSTKDSRDQLVKWVEHINQNSFTGVLVTGQSMYAQAVGTWTGSVADWELTNYDDFQDVVQILEAVETRLICVTGDVHWGRVIQSFSRDRGNRPDGFEIIVSPAAQVATIGSDQTKSAWNWIKGIVGKEDPWPRHADAEREIEKKMNPFLKSKLYGKHNIMNQQEAALRGDQLGLLSFKMNGGKLGAEVQYWSLDGSDTPALKVTLF